MTKKHYKDTRARINLTVDSEMNERLQRLANVMQKRKATVVAWLLNETAPQIDLIIDTLEEAQNGKRVALEQFLYAGISGLSEMAATMQRDNNSERGDRGAQAARTGAAPVNYD